MELNKSTRHSKITGDFAENLILYWLSKYGFECTIVDHTGIDIIARNPHTNELMGISVKGRSRDMGKEENYLQINKDNFIKAEKACKAFECKPYFAIVVDSGNMIYAFITPMEHLLELFPIKKTGAGWKMTTKWLEVYRNDPKIMIFEFSHKTVRWWKDY
ncbi:MAG: hypothetical protein KAR83_03450 [Thermodesulfovibrionales bacterium]|nr:hypothetical protein [Thermodesulfovibrionales bacterium]